MIFVGEQTSYTHAWIASALESGIRGGVQLLLGESTILPPSLPPSLLEHIPTPSYIHDPLTKTPTRTRSRRRSQGNS